jgi:SAM-dependent methyltransferase
MHKEKIVKTIAEFWDRHHKSEVSKDYWTCHPIINEYVNSMISSGSSNILEWFAKNFANSKPFDKGLSLGCGTGVAERQAIYAGLCLFMDGIDISPASVEVARHEALKAGLGDRLRYHVSNLNSIKLPERHYDFALCVGSLHHIENLEHIFNELRNSLKPCAYMLINEYVGPSRLQWTEKQLEILNRVWEIMPPEYRKAGPLSPVNKEELTKVDPSEAVRSSEIAPLLYNYFEIIEHIEYGGSFLMPFWSQGIVSDVFLEKPSIGKQVIIKLLCLIDEFILEEKILPSCYIQIVARNNPPVTNRPLSNYLRNNNRKRWTDLWLPVSNTNKIKSPGLSKKALYVLKTEGLFQLLKKVVSCSKKFLLSKISKA